VTLSGVWFGFESEFELELELRYPELVRVPLLPDHSQTRGPSLPLVMPSVPFLPGCWQKVCYSQDSQNILTLLKIYTQRNDFF
jgi:hypothetical protein